MNKYAAEKISQDYYELGVKIAMDKVSNNPSALRRVLGEIVNRSNQAGLGVAGAGLGVLGGDVLAREIANLAKMSEGSTGTLAGLLAAGGAVPGMIAGIKKAPKI